MDPNPSLPGRCTEFLLPKASRCPWFPWGDAAIRHGSTLGRKVPLLRQPWQEAGGGCLCLPREAGGAEAEHTRPPSVFGRGWMDWLNQS